MLGEVQSEYLEFSRPPYAVDPLDEKLVKQALGAMGFVREAENSTHFSYEMVALSPAACEQLGIELSDEDSNFLDLAEPEDAAVLNIVAIWGTLMAVTSAAVAVTSAPSIGSASVNVSDPAVVADPFVEKRNVLVVLIDAYARHDVMKEVLLYDNLPFLSALESRGFVVADQGTVSYPLTDFSVGSMFLMDRMHRTNPDGTISWAGYDARAALLGENPVVRKFKQEGYRYVLAPPGVWTKVECSGSEDAYIRSRSASEMERALLSRTPLPLLISSVRFQRFLAVDARDFFRIGDLELEAQPGPRFVYAHLGGVHDRIYKADCSLTRPFSPRISVEDHGRGVAAGDLPHIFEPFYRGADVVARQIQGSGLGLALVRRIVEAHGGRVTVASREGSGSTFTIYLPAAAAHMAAQFGDLKSMIESTN